MECKTRLAARLNEMLDPIRERRAHYDAHPELVDDILQTGTARAIEVGAETLAQVKEAMKCNYFVAAGSVPPGRHRGRPLQGRS